MREFPFVVNHREASGDQRVRLVHELHVSAGALRVRTVAEGIGASSGPGKGDTVYEELDSDDDDPRRQGAFEDCVKPRGEITGWSRRSRINMLYRLATLDWDKMPGIPEMVTLTYPAEFPTDGRVVKRHMRLFALAWARKWGAAPVGVWKLEFQRRGAPHLHFYVGRPISPLVEFRQWLSAEWYRIVASGDVRHLQAGTGVDRQFCSRSKSVRSIAWYFAKHNAKEAGHYQNQVPDGFEHVGRFWGVWGLSAAVETVQLTTADFVAVRRVLAALRGSGSRRRYVPVSVCGSCEHADCEAWRLLARAGHRGAAVRVASGLRGAWSLATDPARVAAQLGAWLQGHQPCRAQRRARWLAMECAPVGGGCGCGTHGACSLGHICTPMEAPGVLLPV